MNEDISRNDECVEPNTTVTRAQEFGSGKRKCETKYRDGGIHLLSLNSNDKSHCYNRHP